MRINSIFGFLGSGKTTLVRRLLAKRQDEDRVAVIVNEFGEVGIDGAILEGDSIEMIELTSGCLCCTLKGSLLDAMEELCDSGTVAQVIIEATGIAKPKEIMDLFAVSSMGQEYEIGPFATVVDSSKFSRVKSVLGDFYTEQVRYADVVILNKLDLVSPTDLDAVCQEVGSLNSFAKIYLTEQCDLDLASIFDRGLRSAMIDRIRQSGTDCPGHDHDHQHAPVESYVLDSSLGASHRDLVEFFAETPENLWRAKGFMNVDGASSLIQFAMGQLEITPAEPRDDHCIVFIGQDLDRNDLENRFASTMRRQIGAKARSAG